MTEASETLCLCNSDLVVSSEYKTSAEIQIRKCPRSEQRSNHKPRLFIFYGHGTDTEMIGQDRKPIIDLENVHLLRGWVVYAMACNTAKILGPTIIEAGGLSYIGFNRHFKFVRHTHKVFGKCVNNVVKRIVDGKSLGDAIRLTREEFDYYMERYTEKYNKTHNPELRRIFRKTLKLLMHDKNSLTLLGDSEVRLT